jgi:NAD(P)-dependent dehydrogenase (short-subunit alcohol dehydrogenase family)
MNQDEIETWKTPSMRLDGLTALVTGAGRGIGAGLAIALAEAGADVVAVSRTGAELERVAARIRSLGRHATPAVCDVTDDAKLVKLFAGLPRLDVLVNNAGINVPQPFLEVTVENLDYMLGLNLRAAFLVAQAGAAKMREGGRGGAIVNISSQLGRVGSNERTVYCMTKHGVEGLTKAMAIDLAADGIRVNAIGPTFIETPMTRPMLADEGFRRDVLSRIPLGEIGRVEDLMGATVFLASPAARLITGASLVVDGGWTAR